MLSRTLTVLGIVIWFAVVLTTAPRALSHRHPANTTIAISSNEESSPASCSDLHISFGHHEAVVRSEELTITKAEAPKLRVEAHSNGGIQVQGWDQETYGVTLCKAAEGDDAESVLSQVHLNFHDGLLDISGPSSHQPWTAHLLMRAPRGASMELHTNNGPLDVSRVDGNLKIRGENGPISVRGCSGELDLSSQNGPVTLEENRGKQNVHSENGPLTVTLEAPAWSGSGVEARSINGPVTLRIPSGYRSAVLLESDGNGPFSCNTDVCSEGRKNWDEDHKRIEFGSGATAVHISAVNGPVQVH